MRTREKAAEGGVCRALSARKGSVGRAKRVGRSGGWGRRVGRTVGARGDWILPKIFDPGRILKTIFLAVLKKIRRKKVRTEKLRTKTKKLRTFAVRDFEIKRYGESSDW